MHIYDKDFTQTELPMTKQEIRAISIAKLMLKPNSILIDVGAGTGTIGIEAATYMPQGKVYAIEKEEKGLDTIKLNAEKFNEFLFISFYNFNYTNRIFSKHHSIRSNSFCSANSNCHNFNIFKTFFF